jgi:hypothetical protein
VRLCAHREQFRLVVSSLLVGILAAVAFGALRLGFGDRPRYVHVRWAPAVSDTARALAEQTYHLSMGAHREDRTWGYALTETSRANIEALVRDPAVEDTHQIHRTAFRVGYFAPRLPYQTRQPWIPAALEIVCATLLLGALVGLGLALLGAVAPAWGRGPVRTLRSAFLDPTGASVRSAISLGRWIHGRIPPASAEAVALFRIVFGTALVVFFFNRPVVASWAVDPQTTFPAPRALLSIFTAAPWIADAIRPWLVFWGVLFVVGLMARTAFVMLTIGAFAWAVLHTTQTTYHTVCAPLLTLILLTWSRWGDAWSIDAWRRRHARPSGVPRQSYGYTVWLPSVVLGVVLAAAAVAKLEQGGLAWILNGTVKYHFLSDSRQAHVDLGLLLGHHHWIAVLLSLATVVIEGIAIIPICSRRYLYRFIAGCAAMSLMYGFYLMHGFFWPLWWLLLLSFLPWHLVPADSSLVDRTADPSESWRSIRPAIALVAVLVGQQILVSTTKLQVAPLLSTYDMYTTTYSTPAEYEFKAGQSYWVIATDDAARTYDCRVTRAQADVVVRAAAAWGMPSTKKVLDHCFGPSFAPRSVLVESRKVNVDWDRWRLNDPTRLPLAGPIAAP